MNGDHPGEPHATQLRFALTCLLLICLSCIACGTYLLVSGYQSGELYVGIASSIAGAMAGMISMRNAPTSTQTKVDPPDPTEQPTTTTTTTTP